MTSGVWQFSENPAVVACQTEEIWNLPEGRVSGQPGFHTVQMWRSFSTPSDQPGGSIHTIWSQVTNPGQTLPNLNELRQLIGPRFYIVPQTGPFMD